MYNAADSIDKRIQCAHEQVGFVPESLALEFEAQSEHLTVLTDINSFTEWTFDHLEVVEGKSEGTCRPIPEYQ